MPVMSANPAHVPRRSRRAKRAWAASALLWLARCIHRHRSRADLRDLDPRLLRDIGLTEGQALSEGRKAWWRA
jgi:uncharacterized protein YjiS (DUF1127 family)